MKWPSTSGGTSFRFGLPLRKPPLDVSFGIARSRSTLGSSFSRQMTTVHPIPIPWLLGRLHQVLAPLPSALAAFLLFFIHPMTEVRDTPKVLSIPRKLLLSS